MMATQIPLSVAQCNHIATETQRVAILGSGNWGATIARLVGQNVTNQECFDAKVTMWVFEETVNGKKLSDIINQCHENIKYLPGVKLPVNVVAEPDLIKAVKDSDILVFALPYQFVKEVCEQICGYTKEEAFAISLIKGLDVSECGVRLISQMIAGIVNVDVSAMIGANIADEVSKDKFCEATIGSLSEVQGRIFYKLFNGPSFRVKVVKDRAGVELFGALKYIVGVAAGFCDGLCYAASTKSAIICIGAREMWKFSNMFFKGVELATFLENCGLGDLIVASIAGRNRRVAEAFVTAGKSIEVLEAEMLNGQKMQGPRIARSVHFFLKQQQKEHEYPLFTAVYKISYEDCPPQDLLKLVTET